MPCSKYKNAQRKLCYATNEWKNWSKVKSPQFKKMFKVERKEHPSFSNSQIAQIVIDHNVRK